MTTTLEALEQRVADLEQQVAQLRNGPHAPASTESQAQYVTRIMAEARAEKLRMQPKWDALRKQLGIGDQPVPWEELQALWEASGIKPEECIVSKGIRELREE